MTADKRKPATSGPSSWEYTGRSIRVERREDLPDGWWWCDGRVGRWRGEDSLHCLFCRTWFGHCRMVLGPFNRELDHPRVVYCGEGVGMCHACVDVAVEACSNQTQTRLEPIQTGGCQCAFCECRWSREAIIMFAASRVDGVTAPSSTDVGICRQCVERAAAIRREVSGSTDQ